MQIDIAYLQETHATYQLEHLWHSQWGGPLYLSHGNFNARGVIILLRRGLDILVNGVKTDSEGRYCIIKFKSHNTQFVLCNVYAPNNDNPLFFLNLLKK